MRTTGVTALVAALLCSTALLAAAQTIPVPVPAPKKAASTQAPAPQSPEAPQQAATTQVPAPQSTVPPPRATSPVPLVPAAPSAVLGKVTAGPTAAVRPGEATAFDGNQRALVDRISASLSGIQTLVGDFVQVGPDGRRTEGQFYLQKPGKVRFEYNPPSPIDVVADGQSVVVRDRNLATQDLYPLSQTPLRFLLSDRLDLLRDTNLVSVSADDMFVTAIIEEKQTFVGTHRLMLMFGAKDFQLRQWTVTDPQGYDTTVAVYNLDTSKKPDPNLFKINYERMIQ